MFFFSPSHWGRGVDGRFSGLFCLCCHSIWRMVFVWTRSLEWRWKTVWTWLNPVFFFWFSLVEKGSCFFLPFPQGAAMLSNQLSLTFWPSCDVTVVVIKVKECVDLCVSIRLQKCVCVGGGRREMFLFSVHPCSCHCSSPVDVILWLQEVESDWTDWSVTCSPCYLVTFVTGPWVYKMPCPRAKSIISIHPAVKKKGKGWAAITHIGKMWYLCLKKIFAIGTKQFCLS